MPLLYKGVQILWDLFSNVDVYQTIQFFSIKFQRIIVFIVDTLYKFSFISVGWAVHWSSVSRISTLPVADQRLGGEVDLRHLFEREREREREREKGGSRTRKYYVVSVNEIH